MGFEPFFHFLIMSIFLFCNHAPGMRSLVVWGYVHTGNIHVTFQITFLLFIRVLVIHLESRTNTMFVE